MTIDRDTLLFFDAACLIAAAGRPAGGSGFLLSIVGRGLLAGAVSNPVLSETERNILAKLPDAHAEYLRLVSATPLRVAPAPTEAERQQYAWMVNDKDAHVVAAAVAVGAAFLITHDQALADEVNAAGLPFQALAPGEFIRQFLPLHSDYPTLR